MFYTVYKITNIVNNKVYIGVHKTLNINDGYMGSGNLIKRSISKYGIDNFKKDILFVFDNPEDMFAKEREIVNEEFLSSDKTYNIRLGGSGGWDFVNNNYQANLSREEKSARGKAGYIAADLKNAPRNPVKPENVEKWRESIRLAATTNPAFLGKSHTEETKAKMRAKAQLRTGEKNSSFGTMWITNGTESKKVKVSDTIPDGWKKGRKMPINCKKDSV